MKTEAALRRELKALPQDVATSALAASALALARRLDSPKTSSAAAAALGREIRETRALLLAAATETETDRMTEFERRRDQRAAAQ